MQKNIIALVILIPTFTFGVPQKVVIIWHAEKIEQKDCGPYLSSVGIQRSLSCQNILRKILGHQWQFLRRGLIILLLACALFKPWPPPPVILPHYIQIKLTHL